MTKVTSKLLTLMLSLAMVFTSMGWLGSIEVNAAEGPTVLSVKIVDQDDNALEGIKVCFDNDDGNVVDLDATTSEGLTSYDLANAMRDGVYGWEESYDLYLEDDSQGAIEEGVSFTLPEVENPSDLFFETVNEEAYDGSTVTMKLDVSGGDEPDPVVDFVDMQKNDKDSWGDYGIDYEDIDAEDFILDVRKASVYEEGHMYGAVNADVTVKTDYREGDYIAAETDTATKLDAAYEEAGDRMIVIICNTGNSLAAKAMQYYNETGKDMDNITYLIGGKDSIPAADMLTNAPDTEVPRTTGEARSKTMTTTIDMSKYEGGKVVKVWVPVPHTEDFQTISEPKFSAPTAAVAEINEDANGNKMLYLEWAADADPATRTATLTFNASRVEAGHSELVKYDDSAFVWPEGVAPYITKTSEYVKIDGIVKDYADQITEGKRGTLEKTRAIYEWVIANLERIDNGETLKNASGVEKTFVVEGCGYGDTVNILSDVKNFGRGGGHCTDINSTFVALCRAAGIPAREMFGIRLGTNEADDASGFQHCWAEFYLPGTGWVFADPGDVLKAIKPAKGSPISAWEEARASEKCKERTEYFWGTVDNNRIVLSRGRDIKFVPEQAWGVCNTFGYPAAEVDGQRTPEDFTVAKDFVYSIATKDVVDFVKMQANDKDTWKTYGIEYADIKSDDFILDVRPDAKWKEGHLENAVHVDVTDSTQLNNGYVKAHSDIATGLDAAYYAAGSKRIVIICNGGQTLAARAMQYLNESGKDMDNVTYLIGGRTSIPDEDVVTGNWTAQDFTFDGGNVTGFSAFGAAKIKTDHALVLPAKTVSGDAVTGVGASAFRDNTDIESVEFPESITTIGNLAFTQCSIKDLVLPDTITELGMSCFSSNYGMKSVVLSKSITAIPNGCFTSNATGSDPEEGIHDVVIPEGVTSIGDSAFNGQHVKKLSLPSTLESIGRMAFQNHQISELEIPASVKTVGNDAFHFTQEGPEKTLKKLTLHEGLETIGQRSFGGSLLEEVLIPDSVTSIHKDAFKSRSLAASQTTICKVSTKTSLTSLADGSAHKFATVYCVTFDANGGTVEPSSAYTEVSGVVADLPKPVNEDKHKASDGWFTQAEGGDAVTSETVFTEDTTVYAHWREASDAEYAENAVAALPKEVTEENAEEAAAAAAEARAAYDALSEEEKAALPAGTVEKLEAAEAKVEAAGAKAEAATAKAEAQAAADKLSATLDLVNEVIESVTVSKSKYKTASVKTFTEALAAAQDLLKAETQTTEELKAAATTLKEAREGLVVKSANPLKVTKKDKTVKAKKAKKKAQTVKKAVIVKDNKGKVSYKKSSGSPKLTVNAKNGNITVKKGTKKGTYSIKVKVTAKGDGNYKSGSKTVTVKIIVK